MAADVAWMYKARRMGILAGLEKAEPEPSAAEIAVIQRVAIDPVDLGEIYAEWFAGYEQAETIDLRPVEALGFFQQAPGHMQDFVLASLAIEMPDEPEPTPNPEGDALKAKLKANMPKGWRA